jgi:hypothetical protein
MLSGRYGCKERWSSIHDRELKDTRWMMADGSNRDIPIYLKVVL